MTKKTLSKKLKELPYQKKYIKYKRRINSQHQGHMNKKSPIRLDLQNKTQKKGSHP
jgi:hypothetical protein